MIAESFKVFYKYFKIAEKVKRNHPATKKSYRDYLDKTCRNSFFFTPTTPDEVKSIIKSLDTSKATGPYSIPHQLLNALPTEISAILSEIFNKSFKTGKFHQGYRKQSQCGILEGKDKDERIQNWFNYFKQLLGQEPVIEDEHEVIGEIFHDLVFKTREYVWRVENSVEKIGKIGKN